MGRRLLGWGLVLYGLVGLSIVIGGAIVGLDVAARVERLASAAACLRPSKRLPLLGQAMCHNDEQCTHQGGSA